jgi:hypothetical protein
VIAIVAYGLGNLGSVSNMLKKIGAPAKITPDQGRIECCAHVFHASRAARGDERHLKAPSKLLSRSRSKPSIVPSRRPYRTCGSFRMELDAADLCHPHGGRESITVRAPGHDVHCMVADDMVRMDEIESRCTVGSFPKQRAARHIDFVPSICGMGSVLSPAKANRLTSAASQPSPFRGPLHCRAP